MNELRRKQKVNWQPNKDLEFQVLDWDSLDLYLEPESDSEDESEDNFKKKEHQFIIRIFGVTKEGYSVCTNVTGFKPYFFISLPKNWKKAQVQLLINTVADRMVKYNIDKPDFQIVKRHCFRGFTNNTLYSYAKLSFNNMRSFNKFKDIFYTEINILGKKRKFDLFESNLKPMLRFIHMNDIKAAGWVKLKGGLYQKNYEPVSKCQIDITTNWENVKPIENDAIAPLIIASFDIEADSSHGDFPMPKKTYKKLASDVLVHYWTSLSTIEKYQNVRNQNDIWRRFIKHRIEQEYAKEGKNYENIDESYLDERTNQFINEKENQVKYLKKMLKNEDKYFFTLISSAFGLTDAIENIHKIYTKRNIIPSNETIKSIVSEVKYICHYKQRKCKGDNKLKIGINIIINRMEKCTNIKQVEYVINDVAKRHYLNIVDLQSKIFIKDVLVDFIDDIMSKAFPSVEGDRVIQIGTVVQKYGDPKAFINHIVTLKGCDPIEGAIVVSCDTEKEVLMEWHKFITKLDPDIITGYNIFGFDEIFMYDRSCELNCMEQFASLGRVENDVPKLEEKKLSSSALGDNTLNYIKMTGRVQIDIFKVVQRDHKLNSYKLDFVANNFIRGDICQIGTQDPKGNLRLLSKEYLKYDNQDSSCYIEVDDNKELSAGNFIYLNPKNTVEQSLDGKKFKIKELINVEYMNEANEIVKKQGMILDTPVEYKLLADKDVKYSWGLAKDDVHHTDIFRLQKGSDADRKIIAVYCIQDCALLIYLINKLCIITNNLGMANVCHVPFSYIFLRGQGIKLYSFVSKQCRLDNYLIPDLIKESELEEKKERFTSTRKSKIEKLLNNDEFGDEISNGPAKYDMDDSGCYHIGYQDDDEQKGYMVKDDDDGYEGAIVIKPQPDIYFEPISVTDYGSLYPSSMISENLSHDSIVFDVKYDNLPGYDYLDITYEIKKAIDVTLKNAPKVTVGYKTCRYAQFPDGNKGIIPKVLSQLLKARKATRVKQETETDKFIWDVLEGLQIAYKVTANSLYGQIGARTSPIYLKDIAASTTATGRRLLLYARHFSEKNIKGCTCVYGDSVVGDEPIIIKHTSTQQIEILTIEELTNRYHSIETQYGTKRQVILPSYHIEVYVDNKWTSIRRLIRHKTNKTIYRVLTKTGCVDVTEDHSLIDKYGNMIAPTNFNIYSTIVKYSFPTTFTNYKYDVQFIETTSKLEAQKRYFEITNAGYTAYVTYDVQIHKYIVSYEAFRPDIYHGDSLHVIEAVYPVRKTNVNEYVYDIETDCGWFTAGIGGITLKNTDSIFVKFADKDGNKLEGIKGLKESINKGILIEESIQMYFKKPHKLEYEKTFWPFILFTKKRYVGHLYEKDVNKFKQKSMGIVLKRRDNAPVVKTVYGGVIKTIMVEKDINKSIKFLKQMLKDLLDGKIDINQLIISKTLRGYYKDPDSIAHKVLADRMAERDPGNKPHTNDRIPYVYIDVPEREGMLQGEKIEHIEYAKKHKLIPNYLHYITNQIMKPVSQIYELIVEKLVGYNKGTNYFEYRYKRFLDKYDGDVAKADRLTSTLKKKEVAKLIFNDIIEEFINKKAGYVSMEHFFDSIGDDFIMDDDYEMEIVPKKIRKKPVIENLEIIDTHKYDDIISKIAKEKRGEIKVKKTMDLSNFLNNYQ